MAFKIKAADGTALEIQDGEYYFNTKARARRMMLNSLSNDARRVYACLELATMGFQQELAVIMDGGKIRNLSPSDVCQQTKLPKQKVRDAFEELENEGLAKRESDDGNALRKGHIRLYSWAEPHPTRPNIKEVAPRGYFPSWFPDSWEPLKPLISRFRYSLIEDEVAARGYFEEGAEVARGYQQAAEVAARFLERVRAEPKKARASLYERTERTVERTTTTVQASSPEEDVVVVAEKLGVKEIAARKFLAACRKASPGCTTEDIGAVIDQVDKTIDRTQIRNPTGILLENVPLRIAAAKKVNDEWMAANTVVCWSCQRPVYPEDARMRGAHQKCWDAEEKKQENSTEGRGAATG